MYISKIIISKGKTIEHPKNQWKKLEFTIEIILSENEDVELAKSMGETLLDSWLRNQN